MIVGQAVFPYFGQGSFTPTDLGEGALVTASLLEPQSSAANGAGYNFVLLRFDRGPRQAADMADFERAMRPFCATVEQPTCLITDQRPNSVVNYARIDGTPEVLAGILALLGLAVLAQFAMDSARRRRRDFAVLRTLGLLRGQLIAITAWQAAAMTGLALLVGLPLGVAGVTGRGGSSQAKQGSPRVPSRRCRSCCSPCPWRSSPRSRSRFRPAGDAPG